MKHYYSIENEEGEVIFETVAPTFEMVEERVAQFIRARQNHEQI